MQFLLKTVKSKTSFSLLVSCIVIMLTSATAVAQTYPAPYSTQQNDAFVTVYKDCGFRGKSRALAVGDYRNVRDLNLGNDSISSVRVPNGVQITLYEHERFKGEAVYLDRDISCLDKRWNDEASSLKVAYTNQPQANQGTYSGRSNQYPASTSQYPTSNNQHSSDGYPNNFRQNQNVNMAKLSRVAFANTSLERLSDKRWQIVNPNGSVDKFHETARVGRTFYLKKKSSKQTLHVDLDRNVLVFQMPNGQPVSFPIAHLEAKPIKNRNFGAVPIVKPNKFIANRCFSYRAYTLGGEGGIKFHGHEGFHQFQKKAYTGQLCHDGGLTLELDKTKPSTTVIVEIEGNKYVFDKNEKEELLLNNWYRKTVQLKVGRN